MRTQVRESDVGYTGNVQANNYPNDNGHWLHTVRDLQIWK